MFGSGLDSRAAPGGDLVHEFSSSARRDASPRGRVSDSPWFWVYVFAAGGLSALLIAGPKYQQRQSQMERQFRARVTSKQATEVPGALAASDVPSRPFIRLFPLATFFSAVTLGFGTYWFLQLRRRNRRRSPPPTATHHQTNDASIETEP